MIRVILFFKGLPSTTNVAPRRVLTVRTLNVEASGDMQGSTGNQKYHLAGI